MSKPTKAKAEYFPHYANSGKTMFILESKFGNDGYAAWFKIVEMLTAAENHFYDCRNPDNWEFLLAKTRLSGIIVTEILDLLARLGAINPEFWKYQVIRSDNLIENLSGLYSRRKVNVISNDELKGLLFADTHITNTEKELLHTENPLSGANVNIYPQSKVKESKVKESKEKERAVENVADVSETDNELSDSSNKKPGQTFKLPESLQTADFVAAWGEWAQHRKEIRKKLTPSTAEQQLKKLASMGAQRAIAAIRHSITNGWTGIFEPTEPARKGKGNWLEDLQNLDVTGDL
jgi:hypothetical protein